MAALTNVPIAAPPWVFRVGGVAAGRLTTANKNAITTNARFITVLRLFRYRSSTPTCQGPTPKERGALEVGVGSGRFAKLRQFLLRQGEFTHAFSRGRVNRV